MREEYSVADHVEEVMEGVRTALREGLVSANETDSNGEFANVTDGLFAIARAIRALSEATSRVADVKERELLTWERMEQDRKKAAP
jgi:hypothetical protein